MFDDYSARDLSSKNHHFKFSHKEAVSCSPFNSNHLTFSSCRGAGKMDASIPFCNQTLGISDKLPSHISFIASSVINKQYLNAIIRQGKLSDSQFMCIKRSIKFALASSDAIIETSKATIGLLRDLWIICNII